jgi:hypothetical protein
MTATKTKPRSMTGLRMIQAPTRAFLELRKQVRPVSSDSKKNRRAVVCLRWENESP